MEDIYNADETQTTLVFEHTWRRIVQIIDYASSLTQSYKKYC